LTSCFAKMCKKVTFWSVVATIFLLLACSQDQVTDRPPIEHSFPLSITQHEVNIPVKITEPGGYRIGLRVFYEKADGVERVRLHQLFDTSERSESGEFLKSGIPVEVSVQVSRRGSEDAPVINKIVNRAELYAYGENYFSLQLENMTLAAGDYLVKVKNQKIIQPLATSSVTLHLASNARK